MDGFLDKLSVALVIGWSELENEDKKGQSGSASKSEQTWISLG